MNKTGYKQNIKQYISKDQLDELSISELKILKKGLNIQDDIRETDVNIGRMIELLYSYDCDVLIESAGLVWHISILAYINHSAEELTDALWQTVKELIKKDRN